MTLKRYQEELYIGFYLSGLHHSVTSQIWGPLLSGDRVPSLTPIFSVPLRVMAGTSFSPLSFAPSDMTPCLAISISTPQTHDDGLPPRSNGDHPPCRHSLNSYPPYPYCGKKNHLAKKCWKQFGKPPNAQAIVTPLATLSPASPVTPTPHYHVTLTLDEYDAVHCSGLLMPLPQLASLRFQLLPHQVHLLTLLPLHHQRLSIWGLPLI